MLYDKDIREPLFEFLEETFGKVRIIEEKSMGRSRADAVMVMERSIVGIEIKSDADSYTRLERQSRDYDTFFDENMIVIGSSHALHIKEHVPEWWGIITVDEVDGKPDFYIYRDMEQNPKVDLQSKLSILWREELSHIQEKNEMPKYQQKSKQFVRDKILELVPQEILTIQICEELLERDYQGIADRINSYRVSNGQKKRRKRVKKSKYRSK